MKAPAGAEFFAGSLSFCALRQTAAVNITRAEISEINSYPPRRYRHSSLSAFFLRADLYELEKEPSYWDAQARMTLDAALKLRPREHRAKNIILFLGDGEAFLHPMILQVF